MATQPTNPPSVSAWPASPSRAEPATFSAKADAFLGHFPVGQADQSALVAWLNSTAGQAYQNALESAASATASAASADLAQDVLDNAISATNYKGAWSSLSGALNIPASVSHNDGVWLLTTNLANVAASEPAIGNANWLLIYSRATDLQVETGVAYTNPDSKQLKDFVQRDWGELTTAKTYNDSCFYLGKEYDINIPVDDVTIAPPTTAGRSYTAFDGVDDYVAIPTITLQAGDVVKFKFLAPTSALANHQSLIDGGQDGVNRCFLFLLSSGLFQSATPFKIDGLSNNQYPTDGLVHDIEMTANSSLILGTVGARYTGSVEFYKGRIYDLEVIRSGTRIHYYPLRNDAVDYLAGNLIKDEEFTNAALWTRGIGWSVGNNKATASAGTQSILSIPLGNPILIGESVRVIYDAEITVGSLTVLNSGLAANTSSGSYDAIAVYTGGDTLLQLQKSSNFVGSVSNFRLIKTTSSATDGTEVGAPLKSFEKYWKLKSGEQYLTKNAGVLRFGSSAVIDANNTLEIEPLANGSKGDYIKVTRASNAEPTIKLSAADITAGRLIKFGVQTDTELTIDSDRAVILEHNGQDLEVKL